MRVEILRGASSQLNQVKKLWRVNAETLGFFPEGAFDEYASKSCILVASDEVNGLAGYLLFRRSGDRVVIAHLCIQSEMRGRGIARALFDELFARSMSYRSIRVLCRRDFSASTLWPKLGFIAVGEKRGRGSQNTVLTEWCLDCGNPDLFSFSQNPDVGEKLLVVIDANIFYDLDNPTAPDTLESKALLADWLHSAVELRITPETLNEIDRHAMPSQRLRNRQRVAQFTVLRTQHIAFVAVERKVRQILGNPLSDSDASDVRQLAWAVASGYRFFVTRDNKILNLSHQLYREFGVSPIRPSDLIVQLDELHERSKYSPARVAGGFVFRLLGRVPGDGFFAALQLQERRERKSKFKERLCKYLAMPKSCQSLGLFGDGGKPAALIVYDRSNMSELQLPFLRVARGAEAITILRNLLIRVVKVAALEKRAKIVISDQYRAQLVEEELRKDGFCLEGKDWVKYTMPKIVKAKGFVEGINLVKAPDGPPSVAPARPDRSDIIRSDALVASRLERAYWPLKILDAPIPSYIIAIQPRWAAELFDDELANQDLFGARTKLSLNREGVYYRSTKFTGGLAAPGRILWYVSDDKRYQGAKHIRGCSFLDEVVVGRPKELFRRFDRLGIYTWKNLIELAKGKEDQRIMAIRYSDTQLMLNPIPWDGFQSVLRAAGVRTQLRSPQLIPSKVFAKLYKQGTGCEEN